MRKWMLAAGAAALAIAGPALADPKGDKGAKADHAQHGGGSDKAAKAAKADRGGGKSAVKSELRGDDRREAQQVKIQQRRDDRQARVVKIKDDNSVKVEVKGRDVGRVRDLDDDDVLVRRAFDRDLFPGRGGGLIAGCPPGLDKRDNGCLPPGQAKKLIGSALPAGIRQSLLPQSYRNWYRDDDDYMYRAGDGYIYRVNRDNNLIDGLIPTWGNGYYAMGDRWPDPYNFYNVPMQYRGLWSDNNDSLYRYGNGAIYQVDPSTMLVQGIVSLLAGDLGVGSRLPMGYDVYNVPMAYRSTYYDTPDAMYRYNDGYIYRADPKTQLITAVIDALV